MTSEGTNRQLVISNSLRRSAPNLELHPVTRKTRIARAGDLGSCAPFSLGSRLPEGPRLANDSLDADTAAIVTITITARQ